MTEQEKTIAKIFDKSVEALGIMTKSLCDAIKSTKTDLQTERLYTAEDMQDFAEWTAIMQWIYDPTDKVWFQKHSTETKTTTKLRELWEKERRSK